MPNQPWKIFESVLIFLSDTSRHIWRSVLLAGVKLILLLFRKIYVDGARMEARLIYEMVLKAITMEK